jgi:hypothetical protein
LPGDLRFSCCFEIPVFAVFVSVMFLQVLL